MRCFIAIDVPYTENIARLQRDIEGRIKLVERENIHITLKFLGEIDESLLPKIEQIIRECAPPKYRIRLKGIGFFPNERYIRVVWIGVNDNGETSSLMRCIDEKISSLGFRRERDYIPHLTVGRAKGKISIKNIEHFRNLTFGEILVDRIKIKKSTLTEKGPIYEDLVTVELPD